MQCCNNFTGLIVKELATPYPKYRCTVMKCDEKQLRVTDCTAPGEEK
jgi:hypothetical protein